MSCDSKPPLLITAAQLAFERRGGALILDTRPAGQFASFYIRGSIQISLEGYFASWAAIIIDSAQEIALIAENTQSAHEGYNRLVRVGLKQVIGYSLANEAEWREQGFELFSISIERCEQLQRTMQSGPVRQLIDVRSRAEWLKGHLPAAISIPLLDLDQNKTAIDRSKPSLVYCQQGFRATTAASILVQESAGAIGILIDGIEGWSALGLPLESPEKSS